MFELLRSLIEIAAKAVPALSKRKHEQDIAVVGADLFMFYFRLNEVLLCGITIVGSLEVYVQRMQRHIEFGDDPHAVTAGSWVAYNVQQQRLNLARVGEAYMRLVPVLTVVDGTNVNELYLLLDGKRNAMEFVLEAMGAGRLPINGPSPEQIDAEVRAIIEDPMDYARRADLGKQLIHESISTNEPWDRSTYNAVKMYLEQRNPRLHLQRLQEVLTQLHTELITHFTIEDVLLKVADPKFQTHYNGQYFWGRN